MTKHRERLRFILTNFFILLPLLNRLGENDHIPPPVLFLSNSKKKSENAALQGKGSLPRGVSVPDSPQVFVLIIRYPPFVPASVEVFISLIRSPYVFFSPPLCTTHKTFFFPLSFSARFLSVFPPTLPTMRWVGGGFFLNERLFTVLFPFSILFY